MKHAITSFGAATWQVNIPQHVSWSPAQTVIEVILAFSSRLMMRAHVSQRLILKNDFWANHLKLLPLDSCRGFLRCTKTLRDTDVLGYSREWYMYCHLVGWYVINAVD